ncbi:NAD(P)/FAD-dependent oxidoreductase [Nocardia sp. NPDC101769]|uniref:NAD(P)/FAD-dependent oxidoreductase n=1 Tax=Nocardia sp. NPDC101769 TaxID=3364333 RepID=UPI003813C51B
MDGRGPVDYDAIIVGAGPAGCAAAILLGRNGLRVALLEKHTNANEYKRLCTHSIRSSAVPALRRLGLEDALVAAGAVAAVDNHWTRFGWLTDPLSADRPAHGYNIRRQALDPLMRDLAARTPGVELVLGAKAVELTRDHRGRVDGVRVARKGALERYSTSLVIGADGWKSRIADLGGLPGVEIANRRFIYFAYFTGVEVPPGQELRMWLLEPDALSVTVNDGGVVGVGGLFDKESLGLFDSGDRAETLLRMFDGVSDAPDFSTATRISEVIGTRDYPSVLRNRIAAPGVALVGDAAMVADPLVGAGIGWALQSAEWLCDAVSGPLRAGAASAVDTAARRYQRQHRARLLLHQHAAIDFSRRREFFWVLAAIYAAATADADVAARFFAVGTRNRSPLTLLAPSTLLKVAAINARRLWSGRTAGARQDHSAPESAQH